MVTHRFKHYQKVEMLRVVEEKFMYYSEVVLQVSFMYVSYGSKKG